MLVIVIFHLVACCAALGVFRLHSARLRLLPPSSFPLLTPLLSICDVKKKQANGVAYFGKDYKLSTSALTATPAAASAL